MEIIKVDERSDVISSPKMASRIAVFRKLLLELRKKSIPEEIIASINKELKDLNTFSGSGKDYMRLQKKVQSRIIKLIEKELKIVPINYYRNTWLAIGMSVFGIPFGIVMGASLGNMAFIGIGLPIGMAIGIAIGKSMDDKARENGRQLDIEMK